LQESSIAGSLRRLEWELLFRATDQRSLQSYISDLSEPFTLIASADFKGIERFAHLSPLMLPAVLTRSNPTYLTDHDLYLLLEGESKSERTSTAELPRLLQPTFLYAGITPRVGTTTLALNAAFELHEKGFHTLFIDANISRPCISQRMEIFGVNRSIHTFRDGLDLTEIDCLEALERVAGIANEYQRVVLDLGEIRVKEKVMNGCRIEDITLRWALQSARSLQIINNEVAPIPAHFNESLRWISRINSGAKVDIAITPTHPLSRRDEVKLSESISSLLALKVHICPYERKLLRRESGPIPILGEELPRSLLRRAIQGLLEGR
jgi:hypothetical protein